MKRYALIIFCFMSFLAACAPQLGGYNFSMVPQASNPNKHTFDASSMTYSDDKISIKFSESKTWYMGVVGMSQYDNYDGISFSLQNKTNDVLTIDWNKMSFTDFFGRSGNAVMHQGVKYNECNGFKVPTSIPPKGLISDIIIPCYGLKFISAVSPRWEAHMLPNPAKIPNVKFGIFMPIQIGNQFHNYQFSFKGSKAK
ncbi:MAG: hypothetical protein SWH54_07680 [Thermodesulfobacteriota bacterium]|nr:hypothetical protein [Thermodesulfobacteriota bacterium]